MDNFWGFCPQWADFGYRTANLEKFLEHKANCPACASAHSQREEFLKSGLKPRKDNPQDLCALIS